jgi:hypothetical protein
MSFAPNITDTNPDIPLLPTVCSSSKSPIRRAHSIERSKFSSTRGKAFPRFGWKPSISAQSSSTATIRRMATVPRSKFAEAKR